MRRRAGGWGRSPFVNMVEKSEHLPLTGRAERTNESTRFRRGLKRVCFCFSVVKYRPKLRAPSVSFHMATSRTCNRPLTSTTRWVVDLDTTQCGSCLNAIRVPLQNRASTPDTIVCITVCVSLLYLSHFKHRIISGRGVTGLNKWKYSYTESASLD